MNSTEKSDTQYYRVIDAGGQVLEELPDFARDIDTLKQLYRLLLLTREFDARAVALQRTGRLGTYPSSLGQEATSVGLAHAMRSDDVLVPSFREQGAQLARGVTPLELLLYWGGDERGSDFAGPREDFPVSVPVGSHAAHAVGVALAFKLRNEPRAVVCVFGDGATSKGDVYEAMNCAGLWQLPLVFIVVNNGWAISTPREAQTAAPTLAQKAVSAGFPGKQVDGNDVIAVREVVAQALTQARANAGPELVEAVTYRLADHTTADDASRYRDAAVVSKHWKEDPIARLQAYLGQVANWGKVQEEALITDCQREIEAAIEAYLATPPQEAEDIFKFLYAELPLPLGIERDHLLRRAAEQEHEGG